MKSGWDMPAYVGCERLSSDASRGYPQQHLQAPIRGGQGQALQAKVMNMQACNSFTPDHKVHSTVKGLECMAELSPVVIRNLPFRMMIRNLPCRCTKQELQDAIKELGFHDFQDLQLPFRCGGKAGVGYAFVTFNNAVTAQQFQCAMTGYRFKSRQSDKAVYVVLDHVHTQKMISVIDKNRSVCQGMSEHPTDQAELLAPPGLSGKYASF
jgi:hypothetical protein